MDLLQTLPSFLAYFATALALFGLNVDGRLEWPGMRAPNRET